MGNAMPSGNLLLRSQWTELAQIEATKLNPPSKPWRSSLRMPKTQCSGPKNHVTIRAVFNAMRSTEVFGFNCPEHDRQQSRQWNHGAHDTSQRLAFPLMEKSA